MSEIEWEVPGPPARNRLVVDERVRKPFEAGDYRADMRPATPDDLRAACAAVGLVVGDAEVDQLLAALNTAEAALATEKARAEKAEGLAKSAMASHKVSNDLAEDCIKEAESLRTKLAAAELRAGSVSTCLGKVTEAANAAGWSEAAKPMTVWEFITRLAEDRIASENASGKRESDLQRQLGDALERLSALTAPVEGEPTYTLLREAWEQALTGVEPLRVIYRLGVQHERARHQPTEPRCVKCRGTGTVRISEGHGDYDEVPCDGCKRTEPRATEEELFGVAVDAWPYLSGHEDDRKALRSVALAVAARVRRDPCLVERAVAGGQDLSVQLYRSGYSIELTQVDTNGDDGAMRSTRSVAKADVATVLAEMLGEVGA
jgi:hypothetical protein